MEPLRSEHLAFLKWDQIWFDVERHKKEKALYNVVFSPSGTPRAHVSKLVV